MILDPHRVREARQAAGLSLRAVAAATGVTLPSIATLERTGDATYMQAGSLQRIADALGTTVWALLHADAQSRGEDDDLVAEVAAAITMAGDDGLSLGALADVLGLLGADVDELLASLQSLLRPAGLGVARAGGRVRLTAVGTARLTPERLATAERRARNRANVSIEDVRVVRGLFDGKRFDELVPDGPQRKLVLGRLVNGALVRVADDGEVTPTEDVAYSLVMVLDAH